MICVENLSVNVVKGSQLIKDISFSLEKGQVTGLTGQSGAGKTTLLNSLMGILDHRYCISNGHIWIDQADLYTMKPAKRRELCGTTLGFIPQNPMTAFDSRIKIGKQMETILCLRMGMARKNAEQLCLDVLQQVNLKDMKRVMSCYPAQLSGGMLQRIAVALLLAMQPRFILADEPTSALDEENRELLLQILKAQRCNSGILLISHDVKALSALCDEVMVMEEGRITEKNSMQQLLKYPQREWTQQFAAACDTTHKEGWQWTEL